MRNLALLNTNQISLPESVAPGSTLSGIALDLDEDVLYAATERQTEDADVVVEVWKFEQYSDRSAASEGASVRFTATCSLGV